MDVTFEKWHACHNDFLIVRLKHYQKELYQALLKQASKLCLRSAAGVGADGVLILTDPKDPDQEEIELTIVNSDGSIAQNCGNGIRCAALYAFGQAQAEYKHSAEHMGLLVAGQSKQVRLVDSRKSLVAVQMGVPRFQLENEWHQALVDQLGEAEGLLKELSVDRFTSVELGNKHVVLFGKNHDKELFCRVGQILQGFNQNEGINVHLIEEMELPEGAPQLVRGKLQEAYQMQSFERGVGYSLACGSGACSVARSVFEDGLLDRSGYLAIKMPGGYVYVQQEENDEDILMIGSAQRVFVGSIDL